MIESLVPLASSIIVVVIAVVYVLKPLVARSADLRRGPGWAGEEREPTGAPANAIEALREIEFDRETGKLSDADYTALKTTYTDRALNELRSARAPAASPAKTPLAFPGGAGPSVAAPVCVSCGPRPELDAVYCSTCARFLAGSCDRCGVVVTEPAAQYCSACGRQLAA